jgi:transposase
VNGLAFDVRAALFALLGKDLTQIDGLGPYLSLKLIAECGDLRLGECKTLHLMARLGAKNTPLRDPGRGAPAPCRRNCWTDRYRVGRILPAALSSHLGKAKAVTATARKIAVLFYNAVRHGMEYVDPARRSTRRAIARG